FAEMSELLTGSDAIIGFISRGRQFLQILLQLFHAVREPGLRAFAMVQREIARGTQHERPWVLNVVPFAGLADPHIGLLHNVLNLPWWHDMGNRACESCSQGDKQAGDIFVIRHSSARIRHSSARPIKELHSYRQTIEPMFSAIAAEKIRG